MKSRIHQIALPAAALAAVLVLWWRVESVDRPPKADRVRASIDGKLSQSALGETRQGSDHSMPPSQRQARTSARPMAPLQSTTESFRISQQGQSLPVLFDPSLDEAEARFAAAKHEGRIQWRSRAHRLVARCSTVTGAGSRRAQRVAFTFALDPERSVPGTARYTAVEFAAQGDAGTLSTAARACLARVQGQSLDIALDSAGVSMEEHTIDVYESFLLPVI